MSAIAETKTVQSLTQSETAAKSDAPVQNPEDTVIAIRGLTKVFKDFWGRSKAKAVDNVSFEVRKGEVFGLLGPNGSGKSTTIKMILGLLYPTKGHLEVFGKSPRHVATKERIGYLPEESYLYKYLNSIETLDFFGSLFRLSPQERKDRIEQLLDMVGLSAARRRSVGEFSKGMQRRIGIAQALINDPDLVILDEPTSGLDPIGCREVKDLILALARRGKTVILSSHLLSDVEDVCDRVVIYYGGKVQAMGELGELLATPDSMQIQTPLLSKATTEKALAIIRKEVGEGNVRLETPTQNLESYFLSVVERARQTEQHTSGALSGARVAAYLRSEDKSPAPEKIIQRLTSAYEENAASQKAPTQTQEEQAMEDHEVVQKKVEKLEALTLGPTEVESNATKAQKKKEEASAHVEVIDVSKLSSLTQPEDLGTESDASTDNSEEDTQSPVATAASSSSSATASSAEPKKSVTKKAPVAKTKKAASAKSKAAKSDLVSSSAKPKPGANKVDSTTQAASPKTPAKKPVAKKATAAKKTPTSKPASASKAKTSASPAKAKAKTATKTSSPASRAKKTNSSGS
jgi:ABC-2 type transport system ATP-binding protein